MVRGFWWGRLREHFEVCNSNTTWSRSIRRSVPRVRAVRLNPYPQVSVLPDVRHGCHSPVRSGQSVRKL